MFDLIIKRLTGTWKPPLHWSLRKCGHLYFNPPGCSVAMDTATRITLHIRHRCSPNHRALSHYLCALLSYRSCNPGNHFVLTQMRYRRVSWPCSRDRRGGKSAITCTFLQHCFNLLKPLASYSTVEIQTDTLCVERTGILFSCHKPFISE